MINYTICIGTQFIHCWFIYCNMRWPCNQWPMNRKCCSYFYNMNQMDKIDTILLITIIFRHNNHTKWTLLRRHRKMYFKLISIAIWIVQTGNWSPQILYNYRIWTCPKKQKNKKTETIVQWQPWLRTILCIWKWLEWILYILAFLFLSESIV